MLIHPIDHFFTYLHAIDHFFWSYIGFTGIVVVGVYFSIKTRFYQFRTLKNIKKTIVDLYLDSQNPKEIQGISPLRLYFASVGGMVGLGNIVGVITALLIGGPGSLFWLWIASFFGMLIKYSEIYLGIHFREKKEEGGYQGGPMYYLKHAFKGSFLPKIVALLLCIYGVEVYQFVIITDTLHHTFGIPKIPIIASLIFFTVYIAIGGVQRLATICSFLMPIFIIGYMAMCLWVIGAHLEMIPKSLLLVIKSAFMGHAAMGGFAGSTFILAAQNGIARAVYSGDIGIGYDATIQSETQSNTPEKQAQLAIFSLLTDSIICTLSILVVLVTDLWHINPALLASQYVSSSLALCFPYTDIFMAIFFFFAGLTTILAFFTIGLKCAEFLFPHWGKGIYCFYGSIAFVLFSFFDQSKVIVIMSLSGGLLMIINMIGILKLRNHIHFK